MLLIYSDISTARLRYVLDLVFTTQINIPYDFTNDIVRLQNHQGAKLSYCRERISDEFFVLRNDFLLEGPITPIDVPIHWDLNDITIFYSTQSSDISYEIFAAIFLLVSRYEEYLPFTPDINGRFSSGISLASKNNFLDRPVVNEWIVDFHRLLKRRFPGFPEMQGTFSEILTYDIDVAYKYKGRKFIRRILSNLKDILTLNFVNISNRNKVVKGLIKDPWSSYNYIENKLSQSRLASIFFFLVGDHSSKDKNLPHDSILIRELVQRIRKFSEIGVHPSYFSTFDLRMIKREKERLEKISGILIEKSRQHYLRVLLPQTYRNLISVGIREDYSMGFADAPGFRAGICTPFYFYDLEKECVTNLKVFPITLMDGNFFKYMGLKPVEATILINSLLERVRQVNGIFISIWHNHTLSEEGNFKGWREVHDKMIEQILVIKLNKMLK